MCQVINSPFQSLQYSLSRDHLPPHTLGSLPGTVSTHPASMQPSGSSTEANNGKSQSPHVINLDSDSSSGAMPPISRQSSSAAVKNITIGQITDSVIAKDFASNPMLSLRAPYGGAYHPDQMPVSMVPPDWVRRLPVSQASGPPPPPKDPPKDMGRVDTPDDRQIIRMAETSSPRAKSANVPIHEPVSPPDNNAGPPGPPPMQLPSHYYSSAVGPSISLQPLHGGPPDRRPGSGPPLSGPPTAQQLPPHSAAGPPTSSHQTNFVWDCYVKNRIVEEMRIQEKSGAAGDGQGGIVGGGDKGTDRSVTPGEEDLTGGRPNSRTSSGSATYGGGPNPAVSTTVTYPFSAWNVSGSVPVGNHGAVAHPTSVSNKPEQGGALNIGSNSNSGGVSAEPKPLLSSQYEELSDEEENMDARN